MISSERTGLLKSFLGSLPEEIAVRLARAVEVDPLIDGKSLPHEMILEGLRPALRRLNGSDRTPTPLRFFCLPFEDLFTVVPRHTAKQKGRIARGSVAPIWTWIGQILLPLETRIIAAISNRRLRRPTMRTARRRPRASGRSQPTRCAKRWQAKRNAA